MTGEGSRRHGQRWNPPGLAAVYFSLDHLTAYLEATAHYRYYGIRPEDQLPLVAVAVDIKLGRVLDLRLPKVASSLQLNLVQILGEDWHAANQRREEAVTQAIGVAAAGAALNGLILPSVQAPETANLVAFPSTFDPSCQLTPRRSELLPPKPGR